MFRPLVLSLVTIISVLAPLEARAALTGRPDRFHPVSTKSCAGVLQTINPRLRADTSLAYAQALLTEAHAKNVDPMLVMAVVTVESRWDTHALSDAGARGLGQLMPDTARELGVQNSESARENIHGTTRYLARLLGLFHHHDSPVESAIAAYTLGPTPVAAAGGVPTQSRGPNYVSRVLHAWTALKARFSRHHQDTMPSF